MLTLPGELDRLLPTESQMIALDLLRPYAEDLETLSGNLPIFDTDANLVLPDCAIIGPPGPGEMTFNAAYFYDAAGATTHYIHIRLPFSTAADARWFVKVWGATHTYAEIVDLTYIGYITGAALAANTELDPTGILAPTTYIGSDNYAYLRFKPTNKSKTTIVVHTVRQTEGGQIVPGDITITASATATL